MYEVIKPEKLKEIKVSEKKTYMKGISSLICSADLITNACINLISPILQTLEFSWFLTVEDYIVNSLGFPTDLSQTD